MKNIRKLVLLVMILGIIPLASIGTGIGAESNVVDANVLSTTTTFHGTDFLYIGDSDSTVKRFSDSGNFIDTFVSSGSGGLNGPMGILFEKMGSFWYLINMLVQMNLVIFCDTMEKQEFSKHR